MLASLINTPCTIVLRSDEDYDEFSEGPPEPTEIETFCELQQTRRDEPERQGESSETTWTVFFHADEDVQTADAVIVDGDTYELVGDPWTVRDPFKETTSHIEATARFTGSETGS